VRERFFTPRLRFRTYEEIAERIVIRQDGTVVGEHLRSFGRGRTIYDRWHYVPVLAGKPGAFRNHAPFKDSCRPIWSACAAG
jgi:hypothetical protein